LDEQPRLSSPVPHRLASGVTDEDAHDDDTRDSHEEEVDPRAADIGSAFEQVEKGVSNLFGPPAPAEPAPALASEEVDVKTLEAEAALDPADLVSLPPPREFDGAPAECVATPATAAAPCGAFRTTSGMPVAAPPLSGSLIPRRRQQQQVFTTAPPLSVAAPSLSVQAPVSAPRVQKQHGRPRGLLELLASPPSPVAAPCAWKGGVTAFSDVDSGEAAALARDDAVADEKGGADDSADADDDLGPTRHVHWQPKLGAPSRVQFQWSDGPPTPVTVAAEASTNVTPEVTPDAGSFAGARVSSAGCTPARPLRRGDDELSFDDDHQESECDELQAPERASAAACTAESSPTASEVQPLAGLSPEAGGNRVGAAALQAQLSTWAAEFEQSMLGESTAARDGGDPDVWDEHDSLGRQSDPGTPKRGPATAPESPPSLDDAVEEVSRASLLAAAPEPADSPHVAELHTHARAAESLSEQHRADSQTAAAQTEAEFRLRKRAEQQAHATRLEAAAALDEVKALRAAVADGERELACAATRHQEQLERVLLEARKRAEAEHEQERAELLRELDLQRAACAEHRAHAEAATKELKSVRSIHARESKEAYRLRDGAQRELAAEMQGRAEANAALEGMRRAAEVSAAQHQQALLQAMRGAASSAASRQHAEDTAAVESHAKELEDNRAELRRVKEELQAAQERELGASLRARRQERELRARAAGRS
jgi:hypothetical protein